MVMFVREFGGLVQPSKGDATINNTFKFLQAA